MEEIVDKVGRHIFAVNNHALHFYVTYLRGSFNVPQKSTRELARVRDQSLDTRMDFRTYILDFLSKNKSFKITFLQEKKKEKQITDFSKPEI